MTPRSVLAVILLTCFTFGLYALVWLVKTKREMVSRGADIPTTLLLLVPFVSIWYLWKFSVGVEHVTRGRTSGAMAFLLLMMLGLIGMAVVQSELNSKADDGPQLPMARVA